MNRSKIIQRRVCRFELLELRQVLSATLSADLLAALASEPAYLQMQKGRQHQSAGVVGLTPFQLQSAYGFYVGTQANFGNQYDPITGKLLKAGQFNNNIKLSGGKIGDGSGQTIAIIDSGNDPTIANDLKAFSTQFGLPLMNLTGGPTFKVVNQNGSSNPSTLPGDDFDSSVETSLDVEWVHAIAPNANIMLVEVNDPFGPFSGGAVDITSMLAGNIYARSVAGVSVISNSWGGGEGLGENALDTIFSTPAGHAGETYVFSAGDNGGPASYPSASPNVLSVGGTTLRLSATNKYSSETVWNEALLNDGAGGGGESGLLFQDPSGRLSLQTDLEGVPSFQKNVTVNGVRLTGRGTPDVSWDADPQTGFAVYDSFAFGAATPWDVIGGTSAGAPQWSSLLAIANQGRKLTGKNSLNDAQAVMYSLPKSDFHDITVGNNDYIGLGLGISGNQAGPGYDLASGIGTPVANLVIRDLVSSSGTSFVPATGAAGKGPSSGFFAIKNARLSAEGGDPSVGSVIDVSAASIGDVSNVAISPTQLTGDSSNSIFAGSESSPAQVDDAAPSSIVAQSADDSSTLSLLGHHSRHSHSGTSDASVDSYFAQLDGSALLKV